MTTPGVPLSSYRGNTRCHGVAFHCSDCPGYWVAPLETVIADLTERGAGSAETGVRDVAGLTLKPCPECGGRRISSYPAWAPGPG